MLRKCAENIFVVLILAQVSTSVVIRSDRRPNENGEPSTLPSELFQPIEAPTEKPLHIAPVAQNDGQQVNSAPLRNDASQDTRTKSNNNNNERWTPVTNSQWPNQNNFQIPQNNGVRTFEFSVPNGQFVQYQYQTNPQNFHGTHGGSSHFSGHNLDPNVVRSSAVHYSSNGFDPAQLQFAHRNGNNGLFTSQGFRQVNNDISADDFNGRFGLQNFRPNNENIIDFGNGVGGPSSSNYVVRSSSWQMSSDMDKPVVRHYEYDSRDGGVPREIFFK